MEAGERNVIEMVCKVRSGKNIKGALNYNENKVKEGVAECIGAANLLEGLNTCGSSTNSLGLSS